MRVSQNSMFLGSGQYLRLSQSWYQSYHHSPKQMIAASADWSMNSHCKKEKIITFQIDLHHGKHAVVSSKRKCKFMGPTIKWFFQIYIWSVSSVGRYDNCLETINPKTNHYWTIATVHLTDASFLINVLWWQPTIKNMKYKHFCITVEVKEKKKTNHHYNFFFFSKVYVSIILC